MTSPINAAADHLAAAAARDRLGKLASRRLFLAGAAAGAVTLGLTACGGATSTTETPQATGAAGFPVTVTGKEGKATIPAQPQRVIALGYQRDAETALALGVTPIAMSENATFPDLIAPWTLPRLTGPKPELLNTTDGFPFERIAGLRPDLLLATDSYVLTDNYARLTQIAPTVSYLDGPDTDTWQQRTGLIGKVLGRDEQAQQVVTDTEARITQAARDNPAFAGQTVSFNVLFSREIYTITGGDASATFLEQLGLKISPEAAAQPESSTPGRALISPENLGVLDADIMIVTYQTDDDRAFLESSQLFRQLSAVQNGTYVPMDFLVSVAMAFPSPLTIPYALDGMVPAIAKVLA
ncbi:MAG TPA: iron-siderophore ABC transporter substrate-binding protein [Pseudonocardiaceae bacterium]|nr:iron-siderophore ABC transporter substrate-binding protein [Pseudonocardiaceae bacterium]